MKLRTCTTSRSARLATILYKLHTRPFNLPINFVPQVTLMDSHGNAMDSYSLRIGIRTVSWNEKSFFVNGRPFYFKGCGRYEYEDVSGSCRYRTSGLIPLLSRKQSWFVLCFKAPRQRSLQHPIHCQRPSELATVEMQRLPTVPSPTWWAPAGHGGPDGHCRHPAHPRLLLHVAMHKKFLLNSVSGYLYELYCFCREFSRNLQAKHKLQISALVQRDTNRPSVVMWSVAYVPRFSCQLPGADEYLK